jgi:hypothetical protein
MAFHPGGEFLVAGTVSPVLRKIKLGFYLFA